MTATVSSVLASQTTSSTSSGSVASNAGMLLASYLVGTMTLIVTSYDSSAIGAAVSAPTATCASV